MTNAVHSINILGFGFRTNPLHIHRIKFGSILLLPLFWFSACRNVPDPPKSGKPKDWVELHFTTLKVQSGYIFGSFKPPCANGFELINDSNTYHCYGLQNYFGEVDFDKYNIVVRELPGQEGYLFSKLTIRLWINLSRKEWHLGIVRKSLKSSYIDDNSASFVIRIPKIPEGFKEVK